MGLRHTGHCVTIAERDTYTSDLEPDPISFPTRPGFS